METVSRLLFWDEASLLPVDNRAGVFVLEEVLEIGGFGVDDFEGEGAPLEVGLVDSTGLDSFLTESGMRDEPGGSWFRFTLEPFAREVAKSLCALPWFLAIWAFARCLAGGLDAPRYQSVGDCGSRSTSGSEKLR